MVYVAICDDNREYLDNIANMTAGIFKSMYLPCSIRKYIKPQTLLNDSLGIKFDLIILDIIMPDMTGIELAKRIRAKNSSAEIIFVTTNKEFALEAFDVFPLTYITKPINSEKFIGAIKKFTSSHDFSASILIKNDGGEKIAIPVDSILYLKSQGHTVIYALDDGRAISSTEENFTTASDKLPAGFHRCHRCFTVNLRKVHSIVRYEFIMEDKSRVPISRNDYVEAKRQFTLNS